MTEFIQRGYGTGILLGSLFIVMYDPMAHTLIGFLGAWWCYAMIRAGKGSTGRWLVGFLAWSAAYHTIMTVLNDVTVYYMLVRLGIIST